MELETWYKIKRKEGGVACLLLAFFLAFPSWVFSLWVRLKNFFYDRKWLVHKKLSAPVVSVGNLTAGGTGKTPLVMELAKTLSPFMRIGILTRGYRSRAGSSSNPLKVFPFLSPEDCGDEALLMARALPEAIVISGKNRYKSGSLALQEGANLLFLDDGMQHRRLYRDFEVIVINGADPLGGGHFLPRGLLRDHPARLSKADLIIVNGDGQQFEKVKKELSLLTKVPFVGMMFKPLPPSGVDLQGQPVGVFCAIGDPYRFIGDVERLGCHVVSTFFLPDHRRMTDRQLAAFAKKTKDKEGKYLLCTEKDFIKQPCAAAALPVLTVRSEATLIKNQKAWEAFLNKLIKGSHEALA